MSANGPAAFRSSISYDPDGALTGGGEQCANDHLLPPAAPESWRSFPRPTPTTGSGYPPLRLARTQGCTPFNRRSDTIGT
jgi:hypothetical protein